jgi:5'-methylthioinosine phosphorylase
MPPPFTKTIAIIGGTGIVHGLPRLPLADVVVHRNVAVTWGANSGRVLHYVEGYAGTVRVIVLPRHGPTPERPDRSPAMLVKEQGHEAHVWLLHELEVSEVYAFSTVGALDRDVPLATELCFVVPREYGRGLGASLHSFGECAKTIHPSMQEPFSPELRERACAAIQAAGATPFSHGTYIYNGPDQFETAAEVRATMRLYEGEPHRVVGMTAGPELVLCRQMEIPYAVICSNSNYAQGVVTDTPVTHELVLETMKGATDKLVEIATHIVQQSATTT